MAAREAADNGQSVLHAEQLARRAADPRARLVTPGRLEGAEVLGELAVGGSQVGGLVVPVAAVDDALAVAAHAARGLRGKSDVSRV